MENVKPENIHFNEKGLIPAIVQDARSGEILMMAWMNKESLQKTLEARETWFYSRSRQKLWHKGEESGHIQHIERLYIDCDEDTIVAQVLPEGPACHTGNCTCFFRGIEGFTNQETKGTLSILHALSEEIKDRKKNPQPKSYTNYLLAEGSDKIDKKIGEEASEVIIADQHKDKKEITSESCDLLYHLFVLWENAGIDLYDIMAEMERRNEVKGNKKTVGHLDKTLGNKEYGTQKRGPSRASFLMEEINSLPSPSRALIFWSEARLAFPDGEGGPRSGG